MIAPARACAGADATGVSVTAAITAAPAPAARHYLNDLTFSVPVAGRSDRRLLTIPGGVLRSLTLISGSMAEVVTFTDPSFGCPCGWVRSIDVAEPAHPKIVGEYKIAEDQQSFRARTSSGTAKVRPAGTRKRARAGLRRSREL